MSRCEHGFIKGLCPDETCPHYDGIGDTPGEYRKTRARRCEACGKAMQSHTRIDGRVWPFCSKCLKRAHSKPDSRDWRARRDVRRWA